MVEHNEGDVYFYKSQFLGQVSDGFHYHIVVLDIFAGYDNMPKKGVVIITSYTTQRELFCRRFGKDSYLHMYPNDYAELKHHSLVSGFIYQEDSVVLDSVLKNKKTSIDSVLLRRIKSVAKHHKDNPRYIKRAL